MTDIWEEEAEHQRQQAERDDADPAVQARKAKRAQADFDKGVRLGWWDADGNSLQVESDDEEGDDGGEGDEA